MSKPRLVLVTGGAGFIGSHLVERFWKRAAGCAWSTTFQRAIARTSPTWKAGTSGSRETSPKWVLAERGRGSRGRVPRGGDPERPALGPRAAPVAFQRSDGHAQPAGVSASGGSRSLHLRRVEQRLRRDRGAAQARGDLAEPLEPLRRRQARGRILRQRLCSDDGPRRRQPPLLQRVRPAPGPVESLQRRDLPVRGRNAGGPPARHLRRRPPDPRLHLRPQHRRRQPRRLQVSRPTQGHGPQRRDRPPDQPARPGRGDQPGPRDQPRPSVPAPAPGDVRDSQASLERIKAVLGYEPLVDFEEGLRRTLNATTSAIAR